MHLALPLHVKEKAPGLIGSVLLIALCLALAWQSADLLRLVRGPLPEQHPEGATNLTPANQALIAQLFGSPSRGDTGPAPATNLQLTLLGSFVHSDAKRSSALIQRQGEPAQRYAVGSEIAPGVRLDAVYADRVELLRNGRRESLTFPRANSGQYSAYAPPAAPTEDALDQLDQLQQDNVEDLRQRMQTLREHMQATGEPEPDTPTDQPQESD